MRARRCASIRAITLEEQIRLAVEAPQLYRIHGVPACYGRSRGLDVDL